MRIKIHNVRSLSCAPEIEIASCAEHSVCAQIENQTQDFMMDSITKKETKIIKYDRITNTDHTNDNNNMYLPITSKSEESKDEVLQIDEYKNAQHNETHVSENNETYKENKVDNVTAKTVIRKTNKVASNRSRRSNRLSANDKKENLKKVCNSSKIVKQKTTRKSNRTPRSTKSDVLMLYKKLENEGYYKSFLPSISCINSNNDNSVFDKNMSQHGVVNQEVYQYGLDNRNTLQSPDYNHYHLNHQINFMNSNPWLIASRNGQNITLNNITNMQNNMGQNGFDRQYHTYPVNYNENPYLYSINSMDSYKLLPMENKDYCFCSICTNTNYMQNNIYSGIESLPRTSNTFQPMSNNITSNCNSSIASSNSFLNTPIDSFNSFYYPLLQTDYNSKKLFYKTLNTVNYATNSGCEMTSIKENISPLNNWYHINHLTCNSNLNIPLNTVTSDTLSESLHTGNTNAHFSNHYNRGMVEANVSMDQYNKKDNIYPCTVPTFENLSAPDTHGLDSDKLTNTTSSQNIQLSQNSTTSTDSGIVADITNILPETHTDAAAVFEETSSGMDTKKKDWFSDMFNTIYKDGF